VEHRRQIRSAHLGPIFTQATSARLARILTVLDDDDAEFVIDHLRPAAARNLRRARRDAAIRAAVRQFWPCLSPTQQSIVLSTALRRYAASRWRHDRETDQPVQVFAATMYKSLVLGGGNVLGHRRLFEILNNL
jgi:hypothetical protein